MSPIILGADAGGSKTTVIVAEGDQILARAAGGGAKMRSGKGIACASVIAEISRRALAETGRLRALAPWVFPCSSKRRIGAMRTLKTLCGLHII